MLTTLWRRPLLRAGACRRWYSPLNYDRGRRGRRDRVVGTGRQQPAGDGQEADVRYDYSPHHNEYVQQPLYGSGNGSGGVSSNSYKGNYETYQESGNSIINSTHACFPILSQPTLVIERRIEYMNLFLGFEQSNKYALYDAMGTQIGWLIERDFGIGKAIMRQVYRLHRPFTVDLLDIEGNLLLTIKRPFSFINSHIKAILPMQVDESDPLAKEAADIEPDGIVVGESVQSWHLWRRRYNLFESINDGSGAFKQFGKIDSGFLRWEFPVYDENGMVHGEVSRNFSGLFREAMTDTGVYVLRMDPSSFEGGETEYGPISGKALTLDEKAVMLSNAVSIDFDYFSRHSGVGGGGLLWFGGGDDI